MGNAVIATFGIIGNHNNSASLTPDTVKHETLVQTDLHSAQLLPSSVVVFRQGPVSFSLPHEFSTKFGIVSVEVSLQEEDGLKGRHIVVPCLLEDLDIYSLFPLLIDKASGVGYRLQGHINFCQMPLLDVSFEQAKVKSRMPGGSMFLGLFPCLMCSSVVM